MFSWLLTAFFLVMVTFKYMQNKTSLTEIVLFCIIAPYLRLGSVGFDSLYIACVVFFVAVVLKSKGKLILTGEYTYLNKYCYMIMGLVGVYLFSWICFSRVDLLSTAKSLLGTIKMTLIICFAYYMNRDVDRNILTKEFSKALIILTLVNLLACIVQLNSVTAGRWIVETFQSNQDISYMQAVIRWGYFSRCFGIMGTPMGLGMVMTYTLAFFVFAANLPKWLRWTGAAAALVCGACSASKSFWLGLIIVIIFFVVQGNVSRKSLIIKLISVAGVFCVYVFHSQIGDWIATHLGNNYLYYWNFLKKPLEAFSTRYSEDADLMGATVEVVKKYWILGVGPSSIEGERAIDSAFMNILHHGGVVTLLMVVGYHISTFFKLRKEHYPLLEIFAILVFLFGFGFQTWVATVTTTFVFIYLLMYMDCATSSAQQVHTE